jgi:DNA polymerase-3 subunit chi
LVDKAYGQGHRVYVNAPSDQVARHLDRLLWTYQQSSFVPHGMLGEVDGQLTPVLIGWARDPTGEKDVLVNLTLEVPVFFSRFDRLAEVIGIDPEQRSKGRERYRFYRDRGYPLQYHEMKP